MNRWLFYIYSGHIAFPGLRHHVKRIPAGSFPCSWKKFRREFKTLAISEFGDLLNVQSVQTTIEAMQRHNFFLIVRGFRKELLKRKLLEIKIFPERCHRRIKDINKAIFLLKTQFI